MSQAQVHFADGLEGGKKRMHGTQSNTALKTVLTRGLTKNVVDALVETLGERDAERALARVVRDVRECSPGSITLKPHHITYKMLQDQMATDRVEYNIREGKFCITDNNSRVKRALQTQKEKELEKATRHIAEALAVRKLGDTHPDVVAASSLKMASVVDQLRKLPELASIREEAVRRVDLRDRLTQKILSLGEDRLSVIFADFGWNDADTSVSKKEYIIRMVAQAYIRATEFCYMQGDQETQGAAWKDKCESITGNVMGDLDEHEKAAIGDLDAPLCQVVSTNPRNPDEGMCVPNHANKLFEDKDSKAHAEDIVPFSRRVRDYLRSTEERRKQKQTSVYAAAK